MPAKPMSLALRRSEELTWQQAKRRIHQLGTAGRLGSEDIGRLTAILRPLSDSDRYEYFDLEDEASLAACLKELIRQGRICTHSMHLPRYTRASLSTEVDGQCYCQAKQRMSRVTENPIQYASSCLFARRFVCVVECFNPWCT